mmetsp:Transcript_8108/g.13059  ORF Transcript_8108/g.13059 Transcript_8108/m.13059 type:complete len:195 (+) Transcript_8108:65-649(+)
MEVGEDGCWSDVMEDSSDEDEEVMSAFRDGDDVSYGDFGRPGNPLARSLTSYRNGSAVRGVTANRHEWAKERTKLDHTTGLKRVPVGCADRASTDQASGAESPGGYYISPKKLKQEHHSSSSERRGCISRSLSSESQQSVQRFPLSRSLSNDSQCSSMSNSASLSRGYSFGADSTRMDEMLPLREVMKKCGLDM